MSMKFLSIDGDTLSHPALCLHGIALTTVTTSAGVMLTYPKELTTLSETASTGTSQQEYAISLPMLQK